MNGLKDHTRRSAMDIGTMVVITVALVSVFLIFPGVVAVRMLRNDYAGWSIAILGSMLLMLGPVVSVIALMTTTRISPPTVAAVGAAPRPSVPPRPFRPANWSSQITASGTTCGRCAKPLHEPAGGAPEVMLGALLNFSDSLEYPCKSCGKVYCLECMTVLKAGGLCPSCGHAIGW
jgi:hypothetical protein